MFAFLLPIIFFNVGLPTALEAQETFPPQFFGDVAIRQIAAALEAQTPPHECVAKETCEADARTMVQTLEKEVEQHMNTIAQEWKDMPEGEDWRDDASIEALDDDTDDGPEYFSDFDFEEFDEIEAPPSRDERGVRMQRGGYDEVDPREVRTIELLRDLEARLGRSSEPLERMLRDSTGREARDIVDEKARSCSVARCTTCATASAHRIFRYERVYHKVCESGKCETGTEPRLHTDGHSVIACDTCKELDKNCATCGTGPNLKTCRTCKIGYALNAAKKCVAWTPLTDNTACVDKSDFLLFDYRGPAGTMSAWQCLKKCTGNRFNRCPSTHKYMMMGAQYGLGCSKSPSILTYSLANKAKFCTLDKDAWRPVSTLTICGTAAYERTLTLGEKTAGKGCRVFAWRKGTVHSDDRCTTWSSCRGVAHVDKDANVFKRAQKSLTNYPWKVFAKPVTDASRIKASPNPNLCPKLVNVLTDKTNDKVVKNDACLQACDIGLAKICTIVLGAAEVAAGVATGGATLAGTAISEGVKKAVELSTTGAGIGIGVSGIICSMAKEGCDAACNGSVRKALQPQSQIILCNADVSSEYECKLHGKYKRAEVAHVFGNSGASTSHLIYTEDEALRVGAAGNKRPVEYNGQEKVVLGFPFSRNGQVHRKMGRLWFCRDEGTAFPFSTNKVGSRPLLPDGRRLDMKLPEMDVEEMEM